MGFSRQEDWSEMPFPSPGGLPNIEIKPVFPALHVDSFTTEPPGKPSQLLIMSCHSFYYADGITEAQWDQETCPRLYKLKGNPGGSVVKSPPAVQEMQFPSLGWEDSPGGEGMATHSCILAWRIPD